MAWPRSRIEGRGQLRVGACADVVVFDPVRIQDLATYHEPIRPSVGVCAVYVNGVRSYAEGAGALARAGRMLTRGSRG